MARIHIFKAPKEFCTGECKEIAEMIKAAFEAKGCPQDEVIVTNVDYQGTVNQQDAFKMFGEQ